MFVFCLSIYQAGVTVVVVSDCNVNPWLLVHFSFDGLCFISSGWCHSVT